MTKGQRAMAVAKIYPKPVKHKRGGQSVKNTELGIGGSYFSHARTVLAQAPDLVEAVLAGVRIWSGGGAR